MDQVESHVTKKWRAWLLGIGSLFDLGGMATYQRARELQRRKPGTIADDWQAVGNDLRKAMRQVSNNASNGEYLTELVRAHYDQDEERFNTILTQIITSERLHGFTDVADRLTNMARNSP